MLEQTKKVYQSVLDIEKKIDDETADLRARKASLQKKIESKFSFSSTAKKIEARYEIEQLDKLLEELEEEKKQAIIGLDLVSILKKAHDVDSEKWESTKNTEIEVLFAELNRKLIPLMHEAQAENDAYNDLSANLVKELEERIDKYGIEKTVNGTPVFPMISAKRGFGEFDLSNKIGKLQSDAHLEFDPQLIYARQAQAHAIRNQATQAERESEIKEKGGYHISEGKFVIVDDTKYNAWCNKEFGNK